MDDNQASATGPVGPELLGRLFDEHAAALEFYARQWCAQPRGRGSGSLDSPSRAAATSAGRRGVALPGRAARVPSTRARSAQRRKQHERAAALPETAWFAPSQGDVLDAQAAAKALAELSADQREVMIAHVWGGLSFEQIGQLMDTSDSTAHRRYSAALTAVRQKLREPCPKSN